MRVQMTILISLVAALHAVGTCVEPSQRFEKDARPHQDVPATISDMSLNPSHALVLDGIVYNVETDRDRASVRQKLKGAKTVLAYGVSLTQIDSSTDEYPDVHALSYYPYDDAFDESIVLWTNKCKNLTKLCIDLLPRKAKPLDSGEQGPLNHSGRIENKLASLAQLKFLVELRLCGISGCAGDKFRWLEKITPLNRLEIVACSGIDQNLISLIGKKLQLTHLSLTEADLEDLSLSELAGLSVIQSLDLSMSILGQKNLDFVLKCDSLRLLSLRYARSVGESAIDTIKTTYPRLVIQR